MEFREVRRKDRRMEPAMAQEVLRKETWGVLSLHGDSGYPYGVPVNYAWADDKLYIHCTAGESHKLDAIRRDPRVSFTVVAQSYLVEEAWTTMYASVILFGTARLLTEEGEKRTALHQMMAVLAPSAKQRAIDSCPDLGNMLMIEITPEHISGKCR